MNLKSLFLGLSLLLFVMVHNAVGQESGVSRTMDLWIVAGQSNAVGFDARPKDMPASDADQQILFWWRCGDPPPDKHDSTCQDEWTTLKAQPLGDPIKPRAGRQYGNYAQPEGGFGPEVSLARALYLKQKRPLAVLKVAFSGTGMRTDWNPTDEENTGRCYRALISEFKKATAAAREAGITLKPRGLCWIQGESDANAKDAPNYSNSLQQMIGRLRTDIEVANLPVLIAFNTNFSRGANKFVPVIVEQQKQLANRDANIRYVDTSAATTANYAHFDAAGTLLVGRLFAERILEAEPEVAK